MVLCNHACAGRGDLPPRPHNHGVSTFRTGGMAPAHSPESPCGAQSVRAVAPSRADDQRPFDRLRCRLAGADFLDVFAAGRFFGAATASAGASSGNAAAGGMISPAAVSGQLANLMKLNAAAFCASNPRRAAVKVRASQGSIGCSPMTQCDASRIQPLLAIRVPTSVCKLAQYKTEPPGCCQTLSPKCIVSSPKCIVSRATTEMIRKVSNFDQTTTQNEETFRKGGALWVGALHDES